MKKKNYQKPANIGSLERGSNKNYNKMNSEKPTNQIFTLGAIFLGVILTWAGSLKWKSHSKNVVGRLVHVSSIALCFYGCKFYLICLSVFSITFCLVCLQFWFNLQYFVCLISYVEFWFLLMQNLLASTGKLIFSFPKLILSAMTHSLSLALSNLLIQDSITAQQRMCWKGWPLKS